MERLCLRPDQVRALTAALEVADSQVGIEGRVWVYQDQWDCVYVQRAEARKGRPHILDLQDPVRVRA